MAKNFRGKKAMRFVGIPYSVINSEPYVRKLRAPEVKLLQDIWMQFNGKNNGMLSACHTLMEKRGWAKSSLHRAFCNLLHSGFIVVTRQGWRQRGRPTLVAATWEGIDEPYNKVDYDEGIIPSNTSLGYWYKEKSTWKHKPKVKDQNKITPPHRSRKPELVLHTGTNN